MRKFIAFVVLTLSFPALGQSVLTISPQQCVWRAGDNPAWSAPTIDESAWQPNPHWQGLSPEAHIWVRCHTDLSSLQNEKQPAIQVTLFGAYQLFLNGDEIGAAGNIRSGVFSLNVIRQYPFNATTLTNIPKSIALRITYRVNGVSPVFQQLTMGPPIIHLGDLRTLTAQRAEIILADSSKELASAFGMSLIGVLGCALLGLFFYDRSRFDLLYLGMSCLTLAALRVNGFCASYQMDISATLDFALVAVGNIVGFLTSVLFVFAVARRRVPFIYWLLIAIISARYAINLFTLLLPVEQAFGLFRWTIHIFDTTSLVGIAAVLTSTAPFVAFWPYTRITGRMRPLAALCLLFGTANFTYFIVYLTNNPRLRLPNLLPSWRFEVLEIRSVVTACILIALLVLLFWDQRQIAEERALLAGEMQAASQIQRMLAPARIDTASGMKIDVAFHPMREVGGDFYLCRILPEGRQRILLGDVSGKGAAAAMTAALLLGGATDCDEDTPATVLSSLNRVLLKSRVGGFATCLCADIAPTGEVILANAGHLAPYSKGEELSAVPGLPLGVAADITYTDTALTLDPGETFTLLSDGVVEARNTSGELFGFDRARSISAQTADDIAHAAKTFGQEDDITVLTLSFAPVGVLNA